MIHDVASHRTLISYSQSELSARIDWSVIRFAFLLSPRMLYGWRNFLLRCCGAEIGTGVRIYPSVEVFAPWKLRIADQVTVGPHVRIYSVGEITIGPRTMVSQSVHLCAGSHDHQDATLPLLRLPIEVGSDVWVCSDAFVGPGVRLGDSCVVGARSAVFSDIAEGQVCGGNPAKILKARHSGRRLESSRIAA